MTEPVHPHFGAVSRYAQVLEAKHPGGGDYLRIRQNMIDIANDPHQRLAYAEFWYELLKVLRERWVRGIPGGATASAHPAGMLNR